MATNQAESDVFCLSTGKRSVKVCGLLFFVVGHRLFLQLRFARSIVPLVSPTINMMDVNADLSQRSSNGHYAPGFRQPALAPQHDQQRLYGQPQRVVCIPLEQCMPNFSVNETLAHPGESLADFMGRLFGTFTVLAENSFNGDNADNKHEYLYVNQDEYSMKKVICAIARFQQQNPGKGALRFVTEHQEEEPRCHVHVRKLLRQGIELAAPMSCKPNFSLKYHIEGAHPIPYVTGIYHTQPLQHEEEQQKVQRSVLLSYVGSVWRNKGRRAFLIQNLLNLTHSGTDSIGGTLLLAERTLFAAPLVVQSRKDETDLGWKEGMISIRAKTAYLNSVFSLHPPGDTPTRRGFYESLLLGSIPIVPASAMKRVYRHIFPQSQQQPASPSWMEQMVVTLPEHIYWDAPHLLKFLLNNMSSAEIQQRQTAIQTYAKYLTWNVDDPANYWNVLAKRIFDFDSPCHQGGSILEFQGT